MAALEDEVYNDPLCTNATNSQAEEIAEEVRAAELLPKNKLRSLKVSGI